MYPVCMCTPNVVLQDYLEALQCTFKFSKSIAALDVADSEVFHKDWNQRQTAN